MPTPAVIERSNCQLKPPAGQHGVGALAIRYEEMGGLLFMRSAWDFDTLECLRILNGGKVILGVSGQTHPVVHLEVGPMPADFKPGFTVRQVTSAAGAAMVRVESLRVHDGTPRRIWCEEPVGDVGIAVATGRAIDQIEAMCRENGWGGE